MLSLNIVKMLCEKVVLAEDMALVNFFFFFGVCVFLRQNLATVQLWLACNLHQFHLPES